MVLYLNVVPKCKGTDATGARTVVPQSGSLGLTLFSRATSVPSSWNGCPVHHGSRATWRYQGKPNVLSCCHRALVQAGDNTPRSLLAQHDGCQQLENAVPGETISFVLLHSRTCPSPRLFNGHRNPWSHDKHAALASLHVPFWVPTVPGSDFCLKSPKVHILKLTLLCSQPRSRL